MKIDDLPGCWRSALSDEFDSPEFAELSRFVTEERLAGQVFPPEDEVFTALKLTPLANVRVLILGQDPYHGDGQAHGLSFSVPKGIKLPPSLKNIYKELESDLSIPPAEHGFLSSWARQGVLMLNTVLTVRAHEANSHQKRGWESFTTSIIERVNQQSAVAFLLWGKPAQKKESLIDARHLVIKTAHPSPLSAYRGFFGSKPFSQINQFLTTSGLPEVNWDVDAEI